VNHLSDDPYAASQSAQISSLISANDQSIANNDQLRSKFDLMDTTIQASIRNLDNARVTVAQALSGTTTPQVRQSLADQISGIRAQALSLANTQFNGLYLFAGTRTNTTPFVDTATGIAYQGNNQPILQRLDRSATIQSNITGQELYMQGPAVFEVLDRLRTDILNNDEAAIATDMQELNQISDRFNTYGSLVGNSQQMVDQVQANLKDQNLALQAQTSRLMDANLVKSISDFNLANQAVEVSLSSQARIQQLSLIDYLQ
jgi:flagellar hook-associated protein 3 FlgL